MKILFSWDDTKEKNSIYITSHSLNKEFLKDFSDKLTRLEKLTVTHPSNNRKQTILIQDIEAINALGHLSKIILKNQDYYFYPRRLKELGFLEDSDLYQINQSTIINLNCIQQFQSEKYARLELVTKDQKSYIVSRHYAKKIKEKLL